VKNSIAVIGLGYVGLPLAIAFAKHHKVIGYDINRNRVKQLIEGLDTTGEILESELVDSDISFTSKIEDFATSDTYIITVPTPVDVNSEPDLSALESASLLVGKLLCPGNIVIYESTVYPGCTEEVCLPILENESKMELGEFYLGYSPERINPADKKHTLQNTVKVVSGHSDEALQKIAMLYEYIIEAGVHQAQSIKVAEATKIIENIQRDVNIALMNEFSRLLRIEGIDTSQVIDAASTKWNFLRFVPGLVGGHCIGVDPYYMIHRAKAHSVDAPLITLARQVNNDVSTQVAGEVNKLMNSEDNQVEHRKRILCLGVTFKENCPDYRNTKVVDMITSLKKYGYEVDVYDPVVEQYSFEREYGIKLLNRLPDACYDAIVCAVPHIEFRGLSEEKVFDLLGNNGKNLLADLKGAFEFLKKSNKFTNTLKL
jgi:UDP-N-acetyl-D-glucosamine/UDP-N-acetyl-D-galactosamine dehydrogenase